MSTHGLLKLCCSGLTLIVCLATGTLASDRSEQEKKFEVLQQEIERLKQSIDANEDNKSEYVNQLKDIELSIGKLSRQIHDIGVQISNKRSELEKLRQMRLQNQQKLGLEIKYLEEQVYTAFTLGKQEKIKLLFSQQDPKKLQRNLVYYQYFSNARVGLIEEVNHQIDEIIQTEDSIQAIQAALMDDQQMLNQQKAVLVQSQQKREHIVSNLDRQLQQQGNQLSRLEEEARQLQRLIDSIHDIFDTSPQEVMPHQPFAKLKGKLAWPVEGKLRRLFGRRKPLSNLPWQGVIIEAPSGRYVHAVSHGRIAFADWLRGFGNLIIIDHGDAYLSLYGHNESLYRSAGEWVETGDVIGSTGNSGGQEKTGLYFEIRRNGRPQNPTGWCVA